MVASSPAIPLSLRQRDSLAPAHFLPHHHLQQQQPQQRVVELVYRVALVGDDCTGKTSLCDAWRTGRARASSLCECTMGAAFLKREVRIDHYAVRLEVWDTGGQARFDNLTPMYIMEADGVIAVYDVTSRESFDKAKYWVEQTLTVKRGAPVSILLAANKTDLLTSSSSTTKSPDVVPHEEAQAYAAAESASVDGWLPVSARDNVNVDALFLNLAHCLVEAERARVNRRIVASLDIRPTGPAAVSVASPPEVVGGSTAPADPLALAPVIGLRLGLLPTLPWLPDAAAASCMLCRLAFTLTRRRHHCRRCGRLVCQACSRQRAVLPGGAGDTPGSPSSTSSAPTSPSSSSTSVGRPNLERVCDHCAAVVACWTAIRA